MSQFEVKQEAGVEYMRVHKNASCFVTVLSIENGPVHLKRVGVPKGILFSGFCFGLK